MLSVVSLAYHTTGLRLISFSLERAPGTKSSPELGCSPFSARPAFPQSVRGVSVRSMPGAESADRFLPILPSRLMPASTTRRPVTGAAISSTGLSERGLAESVAIEGPAAIESKTGASVRRSNLGVTAGPMAPPAFEPIALERSKANCEKYLCRFSSEVEGTGRGSREPNAVSAAASGFERLDRAGSQGNNVENGGGELCPIQQASTSNLAARWR
jgi:hypothetical protein